MTQAGQLFESFPTAGSYSDTSRLELLDFCLPPEAQVVGNYTYDYYPIEDHLADVNVRLNPIREKHSKCPGWHPGRPTCKPSFAT